MKTRAILVIAILAMLVFIGLSIPYQFEFNYWAELTPLWIIYFVVGFGVAVYAFFAYRVARQHLIDESEEEEPHANE